MAKHNSQHSDSSTISKVKISSHFAALFVFGAGVLWGTMGIFVRAFNAADIFSLDISEIRCIGCAFFMLIVLLVRDHHLPRVKLKDLWCFLGSGLLSILLFNVCYFSTIQSTSMSVAAVLLYTAPAFVMLLSRILFKERLTKTKIIALILTFLGCCLTSNVFSGHAVLSARGLFTGILSGIGYALYTIFSRYALNRGYDALTSVFFTFLITSIGGAFFADFPHIGTAIVLKPSLIGVMIVYVLFTTVFAYVMYTYGLTRMENSRATIVVSVEPVAATVFGLLFFNEIPTVTVLLGMAAVLTAIIIVNVSPKDKQVATG